jgi:epoxyqueuosine reductase
METRLRRASMALQGAFPARYRYYVDTGPILERDWAEQAGIGWIGKNTCSIDPERGSYFFLGEILTTLALDPDLPAANHCGACRSCLDACPTGALVNPYELDARLCISYLTIEHRGAVPEALEPSSGNLVFGCDICQEVCPFNRPDGGGNDGRPARAEPELAPRRESISPSLESLAALDEEGFRRRFPRSAVRRAKFEGFLRNVIVALGNSRSRESAEILARLSKREDVSESQVLSTTLERAQDRCRP